MKILRLEITEFGGLRERVIELGEGLNILEGQNESGKSTVLAFIRFMLYGLSGRMGGAEPSEKERYVAWSSGRAAGSMTLTTADGRCLRIEREGAVTHTARGDSYSEKPVRILDGETGELISRGQCPGELLLGLTAAAFGSTCAVSQLKATELNAGEVSASIENMLRSADESISVPRVCKRLEDARRELIHKTGRGGRIYELRCKCERLEEQLERAEDNARSLIELEARSEECRRKTAEAAAESARLDELWERSEAWLTLGRFERHEAESAHLAQLRERLAALERDSFEGGYLPPEGYDEKLSAAAERVTSAESALSRARLRCEQHAALPTYDEALAELADRPALAGQAKESLLADYRRRRNAVSRRRTAGILALICGLASAAVGAALWLLLEQILPGAALAGVGLVAGICGAALLSTVSRAARSVTELIASLGLGEDPGADGLARHIDSCRAAAQGRETHLSAARALDDVRSSCESALAGECAAAAELLAPLGVKLDKKGAHAEVVVALGTAAAACRRFARQRGELLREIAAVEDEVRRLAQSIEGCDRQFLMQKASRIEREAAIGDEEHRRRREQCTRALREAYDEQTALERRIAFTEAQQLTPARVSAQLEAARDELALLTHRADAMTLALEAIESASGQLRRGFTPALREEAQRLLSLLTDGSYNELGITDELALSAPRDGVTRSVALLSGGTRDAIYLSVRLALTRLLCRDELPPLLLDEALSQLDDLRAARVLELLGAWCRAGGQCLLFTCHGREGQLAGDDVRRILLLQ